MTLAGLDNLAPGLGISEYGQVPLETMIAARPAHIVHLVYRPGVPSMADAVMHHPVLKHLQRGAGVTISGGLLNCATPLVAAAAEQLETALATEPAR